MVAQSTGPLGFQYQFCSPPHVFWSRPGLPRTAVTRAALSPSLTPPMLWPGTINALAAAGASAPIGVATRRKSSCAASRDPPPSRLSVLYRSPLSAGWIDGETFARGKGVRGSRGARGG
jgi:hypothetical protein